MALGQNLKRKNPSQETKPNSKSNKKKTKSSTSKTVKTEPLEVSESIIENGQTTPELQEEKDTDIQPDNGIEEISEDRMQIVVFPVEGEEYAFDIGKVKEVVSTPQIAAVPHVADYIQGVANIRGNVMAIIDLRKKLGFEVSDDNHHLQYLMVINDEKYQIAFAVRQVPETMVINKSEISRHDSVMMKNVDEQKFLKGIIKRDNRMIMLLDILEMFEEIRQ